ncbi:hypothetical protein HK100_000090 [Physocladia obscura]|uniref:BZIP domain-containing protein n=1 Tax=Physocladia obscura TaxID=109957 RepID=A0AAD5XGL0_9FUNG|nr:hypothetical protein HK100_000090 [Physocladia obscura]
MFELFETPSSNLTSTSRYNPHNNRGRPKQTGNGVSKRNQQMRDAQRALRARKQQYILNLETSNQELLRENSLLKQQLHASDSSVNLFRSVECSNPSCITRINQLQTTIDELIASSQYSLSAKSTLPQTASNSRLSQQQTVIRETHSPYLDSDSSARSNPLQSNGDNMDIFDDLFSAIMNPLEQIVEHTSSFFDEIWNIGDTDALLSTTQAVSDPVKSAEETFGPLVLEPYKTEVKALPSLGDSTIVERAFNIIVKQSQVTDIQESRILMLRSIRESWRLRSRCNITDKSKIIKIMARLYFKNVNHYAHSRRICAPPNMPKTNIITDFAFAPHRIKAFCSALQAIPSLANMKDELTIFSMTLTGKFDATAFFRFQLHFHTFLEACKTEEEAIECWFAMELLRQPAETEMDELLAGVEASKLMSGRSSGCYDPHNTRGRPKVTNDSENKRIQQMRNAQRTLRARKQEYLLKLETENKKLLQENTSLKIQQQLINGNSDFDIPCLNPQCIAKTLELQAQIDSLSVLYFGTPASTAPKSNSTIETIIMPHGRIEKGAGNPIRSIADSIPFPGCPQVTSTNADIFNDLFSGTVGSNIENISMFDHIWNFGDATEVPVVADSVKSAEEIFGPIVIEPYKSERQALTSIGDTKITDRLFDVAVVSVFYSVIALASTKFSQATDTREAKILNLRLVREQWRLRSRCTKPCDRNEFIKITARLIFKNFRQLEHSQKLCILTPFPNENFVSDFIKFESRRVDAFCHALQAIPSLSNMQDEIKSFAISIQQEPLNIHDFFRLKLQLHTFFGMCKTEKDAIDCFFSVELLRQPTDHDMDELLAGFEAATI